MRENKRTRAKISIIGAGNVGTEVARWCAVKELGDIVLWNRTPETGIGQAYDLMESAPLGGFDVDVLGTGDVRETRQSRVLVITAGVPRKAGQTREELVRVNAKIIGSLTKTLAKLSPQAVIIVVTNPLDAMTYFAYKASGFPSARVVGMAGVLDSSRFSAFVAHELHVSVKDVEALTIGSHGEDMIPLSRFSMVRGIPISDLLSAAQLRKLEEHTKKAGEEIIRLLGTNASLSTGAAVAAMVEAILHDERRLMPCSAYLRGEYGIRDLYIGVPVVLGANGVERVVELRLTAEERGKFKQAAVRIREITEIAKKTR